MGRNVSPGSRGPSGTQRRIWKFARRLASWQRNWRRAFSSHTRRAQTAARQWWRNLRRPLTLGELGERQAQRLLRREGMQIVAARHRERYGELDIVAVDGRTVVFVEVKTRRDSAASRPAEAIDARRQGRLVRAAAAYLKSRRLVQYGSRFDVVEVIWPCNEKPTLRHIRSAFRAEGPFHFGR